MQGRILKGVGSFYTILGTDEQKYVCKARGRFRKDGVTPVPGDLVEFAPPGPESEGRITEILPRKNLLVRPAVANLDQLIVVISASVPQPDLYLADKLLIQCELSHIRPVLVLNKCDQREPALSEEIAAQYAPTGYPLLSLSAHTGQGKEELKKILEGCVSCFAGQSAVGKSSLLNMLLPELTLTVGDVSRKTERGRHTTRHAELWPVYGGAVVDTPGFSLLDIAEIPPEQLPALYPEMRSVSGKCRFAECLHVSEPACAVKELLHTGALSQQRYNRYLSLLAEAKEHYKHRYD